MRPFTLWVLTFAAVLAVLAPAGWANDHQIRRADALAPTVVLEKAVRGDQFQIVPPPPPPALPLPPAAPAAPPMPISGDCDSWKPLLDHFELPWSAFKPRLWRESRCQLGAHAVDGDDHSHGGLQVNRIGNLAAAWDSLGFDHDYMHTTYGAIHAAGVLFKRCGHGPWTGDYGCGFPNGAVTRWEWPSTTGGTE